MSDYSKIKSFLNKKPQSKQEAVEQDSLERAITAIREERLLQNPIQGNYDFEHLAKIHKYLFDGLHDYAGKLREIEPFFKQNEYEPSLVTIFANKDEILPTIQETSEFLKENNYLKDFDRDNFIYEFSISYAEFNFAHPFEEGNGRATRILFKKLAQEAGYEFDTNKISKKEWDMASTLSCEHGTIYDLGDGNIEIEAHEERYIHELVDVMEKCLTEIRLENQIQTEFTENKAKLSERDQVKVEYFSRMLEELYKDKPADIEAGYQAINDAMKDGKIAELPDPPQQVKQAEVTIQAAKQSDKERNK